eukprot:1608931-Amphidinium_carterae.1
MADPTLRSSCMDAWDVKEPLVHRMRAFAVCAGRQPAGVAHSAFLLASNPEVAQVDTELSVEMFAA